MKTVNTLLLIVAIFLVVGCAPQKKYVWGNYDQKLYNHYKNPVDYDQFVENLKGIIDDSEKADKVPPGLYAEYGFVLYEKGMLEESRLYFQKEYDKWPESRVLMTKMLTNTKQRAESSLEMNEPLEITKSVQANEANL